MKPRVWRVEDDGEVQLPGAATAEAGLVSLPFLVSAVRRRWRRVVATVGVCVFLALGLLHLGGVQHDATVTLLLTSDPNADPTSAMETNVSLAHTRTVAEDVVKQLHLPLGADAFQGTVTATPLSNSLMTVAVTAPSDREAIRRVDALTAVYLKFRAQQMSTSADSAIKANDQQIANLKAQISAVTTQYDAAASSPRGHQLADTLQAQRAQLQGQLSAAELENAQTQVQNQAIVDASHVVDGAAIVHKSRLKKTVLTIMSGLIGGTALGLAIVLVPAVLSTRLRRRDDVARALGLPVRFSAGAVSSRWSLIPVRRFRRNSERLAHGLATALPDDAEVARLTVATVGDVRDGAYVVGALADELARESTVVAVVDLSASSVLARPRRRPLGRVDPIRNRQLVRVHRHDVRVSELARRTRNRVGSDTNAGKAEVVLTLIELDLGAGVEALGELADAFVVLVSTGRVSAERLRSSATLLRQSGIQPAFAMLAGADETDDSSGLLEPAGVGAPTARRSS